MKNQRYRKLEPNRSLMERAGVDELELVPENNRYYGEKEYWLWGYGTYPYWSVLAGQQKRARLRCFDSVEEAHQEYPEVPVRNGYALQQPEVVIPIAPPRDFDPADAGEVWGEDEY